ncbi:monomethylamine corrinoid methyltransferase [Methanolobus psychrophilus R15]|nr:monomethylamine corrinoid methyltransferase [Methanolobus psychrophilus R15]
MICSDSHEVSQLNELKIDLDAISVMAHYQGNSNIIMDEQMPIFGGYAGGIEETAIVDIATHLNAFVMSNATWHLDGPVHIRWGSTNQPDNPQESLRDPCSQDRGKAYQDCMRYRRQTWHGHIGTGDFPVRKRPQEKGRRQAQAHNPGWPDWFSNIRRRIHASPPELRT